MRVRMLVVAALAAVGACVGATGVLTPAGEPLVRGPIESMTHHATASSILVAAGPGSREGCGISATVDADTRYLVRTAEGALSGSTLTQLAVGDTVEVFVSGPVAESCPVQGYASFIVRLEPR